MSDRTNPETPECEECTRRDEDPMGLYVCREHDLDGKPWVRSPSEKDRACNFCGKALREVKSVIVAEDRPAVICNECVGQCVEKMDLRMGQPSGDGFNDGVEAAAKILDRAVESSAEYGARTLYEQMRGIRGNILGLKRPPWHRTEHPPGIECGQGACAARACDVHAEPDRVPYDAAARHARAVETEAAMGLSNASGTSSEVRPASPEAPTMVTRHEPARGPEEAGALHTSDAPTQDEALDDYEDALDILDDIEADNSPEHCANLLTALRDRGWQRVNRRRRMAEPKGEP